MAVNGGRLPVLDFSSFLLDEGCMAGRAPSDAQRSMAAQLDEAMRTCGFVYLENFGVTEEDLASSFEAAQGLFLVDTSTLAPYDLGQNIGYKKVGTDNVNHARPADLKETFTLRSRRILDNDYSGAPEAFAPVLHELWDKLEDAARRLMVACAVAMNLPVQDLDFFARAHAGMESSALAINHYPPCDFKPDVSDGRGGLGALRLGEHAAFGMFTILLLDGCAPGLQVRKAEVGAASDVGAGVAECSDGWINADGRGGATAILNIGAAMARWTNDRWQATAHRVVVPSAEEAACHRYSIPFFVQPDVGATIAAHSVFVSAGEAARYAPISAEDHLQMKLADLVKAKVLGIGGGA